MNFPALISQVLPEVVLVVTALLVLGLGVGGDRAGKPMRGATGRLIAAAGSLLAIVLLWSVEATAGTLIAADALSRMSKTAILAMGLLSVLLPPAKGEIKERGEFLALMLFSLAGLSLASGTNHLLLIFVALELASLSLYLVTGFPRTARAGEASLKYFLFGSVSAAFLLFGISLVYGATYQGDLARIGSMLDSASPLAAAGLAMMLAGIGFKLAAAPFHAWAPDVYQGGPAPGVAIVASASKVAGLVVAVRILLLGFGLFGGSAAWGALAVGWAPWIGVLAAVSMIFGNLLALAQTSVRRLLGYSAIANTGYLLVALAANDGASAGAALYHITGYGFATIGAFAVVAAVEKNRGSDSRDSFSGLVHRSPLLAISLLIFLASLAGLPPLAGFTGKFAMFASALKGGGTGLAWLVILGALLSAVSLYYYILVLKCAFGSDEVGSELDVSAGHRVVVLVSAVLVVGLGMMPSPVLHGFVSALADLMPG
ncbi:MAG: NADH-quinone oxidoreductase subunit N [Akkermansiaceae bacterium]|nr:NADH-quinone oxidoreductase subunit N [Akkermansiaceae bacterium]MCP5542525.1 NADH-quinone oxidoreductase subunit N [Akkermansiaceae bacterium]MCP5547935.1 NADH-quinone oxidoreductase subunit N [Akkermansiaceae bacterium]